MSDDRDAGPITGAIAVANAPVSYGAFELTVGRDPDVPRGEAVLNQVQSAGYAGIDLGPVGYLGNKERLGESLAGHDLGLAGAYVELPYADHDTLEQALPQLDAVLDTFDAVRDHLPGPPPRPTLADSGSPLRGRCPAGRSPIPHSDTTPMAGAGLRPGWPGWSPAAATAVTSRPSIRKPELTSRHPGRSSG